MNASSLARRLAAFVLLWCATPFVNGGNGPSRQLTPNSLSLNFQQVTVGTSSALSLTVTNTGSGNVNLKQAGISGAGFSVNGPMLPLNLSPGRSTSFTVTFAPVAASSSSGTLSLVSNAGNSPTNIGLSGMGMAATTGVGQLTPNPTQVNFGTVMVGSASTQSVTVSNTGTASATVSQDSITGSGLSVSGLPAPVSLAPGQSISLSVKFAPTTVGTVNGQMTVSGTAANSPLGVPVSGSAQGTGQLTPNPTSVNFGTVMVGSASAQSVTVSNTGTGSATVSQDSITGSGFSVSGLPSAISLAPGQSISLSVKFAPVAAGTANGQMMVSGTAANSPLAVPVSGSGQSAPSASGQIAVNPTSLSFGNVTVGTSSGQPVAILNTGTGNTTISSANVTGSGYSVSGLPLPLTLTPGQGTTFQVNFDPSTTGSLAGSVSLVSDASTSPNTIPFSGSGVLAHSVSLSWTASTSTVSGYNVYRGSQSGGPYTRMTSTLDTSTVYTDSTVQSGQTYYYVTTAVDASGSESPYSNQVPAVVPTP